MKKSQLQNIILEAYAEVLTELNEAPDRYFYIKISKDKASQNKAQVVLEDMFGIKYEIQDDPDGIILYFSVDDYNPGLMDELEGEKVEILDTNSGIFYSPYTQNFKGCGIIYSLGGYIMQVLWYYGSKHQS